MRKIALLAFVAVFFSPFLSQANDAAPNMIGTWKTVEGAVGHWEGGLKKFDVERGTLVVTEQANGLFRGTMTYASDTRKPKFEGKDGHGHVLTEDILGLIEWDNRTVIWVDHFDETVHKGRLVDANRMEVIGYEPGDHAVVTRSIMVRQ